MIECTGGVQYFLQADTEDMCREWIKQIWQALQAKQEAAEEFDEQVTPFASRFSLTFFSTLSFLSLIFL